MVKSRDVLSLLLGAGLLLGSPVGSADLYIYKERDGTRWITDHRMPKNEYQYIGKFGRPPATRSCTGVTPIMMAKRAQPHVPKILDYAEIYDVDARLVKAIITVESCFDTRAISRVGAKGLMQLMPATAERMGVHNVFSANDNMLGGIRYFRRMLDRFEQNTKMALAAYNAGPHAVDKYDGIPPYKETQNYVRKVLKYYDLYSRTTEF